MVASVVRTQPLSQPSDVQQEELHLAPTKSISLSSSSSDDDEDDDGVIHNDDDTIVYNNTTSNMMRQRSIGSSSSSSGGGEDGGGDSTSGVMMRMTLMDEQRALQHSPSSVVPIVVRPINVIVSSCSTSISTTTTNDDDDDDVDDDAILLLSVPSTGTNGSRTGDRNYGMPCAVATTETATTLSSSNINDKVIEKPFFIMDFLEEIDPTSLALVQNILRQQTDNERETTRDCQFKCQPTCRQQQEEEETVAVQHVCTNLKSSSLNPISMAIQESSDVTSTTTRASPSFHFLRRSIEVGNQYNNRGIIAAQCGQWNKALQYWFDTIEIRNQIYSGSSDSSCTTGTGNSTTETTSTTSVVTDATANSLDLANIYNNIGIAYGKVEQYDLALQYLHQALELRLDLLATGTPASITTTSTTLIVTTASYGTACDTHTPSSLSLYDTLLSQNPLDRQQQQPQYSLYMDIATSLHNIGNIYQQQNELSLAIRYYIQCKVIKEDLITAATTTVSNNGIVHDTATTTTTTSSCNRSIVDIARTCIAIGNTYASGHSYSDAYEAYHDAITIFHQMGISSNGDNECDSFSDDTACYYTEYKSVLSDMKIMEEMSYEYKDDPPH